MIQNSCELANAKVNYINTLRKCIVSLVLCYICFYPSVAWANNSYTRGGGSVDYGTYSVYEMLLKQGYVSVQDNGELLHEYGTSQFYSDFIRVDTQNLTVTASNKKLYNITTNFNGTYWISFYNYNGSTVTFLGNTPKYQYLVDTEVPGNTTFFVINSTTQVSGSVTLTGSKSNSSGYLYTFDKYNNTWELGLKGELTYEGGYKLPYVYGYLVPTLKQPITSKMIGTKYYFSALVNTPYVFQNGSPSSLNVTFAIYDSAHNGLLGVTKTSIASGSSYTFTTQNTSVRYMKVFIEMPTGSQYSADLWKSYFSISNLDTVENVYSSSYQMDTSSKGTIINNYYGSTNTYNITSGDNSPITIVDGNNNTITLPGASPIVNTPSEPVPLPNEGDTDDGSGGGIFDGIGDLLSGLLDLIMIPINAIISAITNLLSTVGDTVTATAGMGDFYGNLFGWLPQPIPALIVTAISSFIIIAIIKFLRG